MEFVGRLLVAVTVCLGLVVDGATAQNLGVPHPSETMAFTLAGSGGNCSGCEWIAAEGPITSRTPEDFESFLKSWGGLDGRETIYLNSPGGDLVAGLRLGEAIRSHRFNTSVGQTIPMQIDPRYQRITVGGCFSACAYAFLGGVKRSVDSRQLGFHQFVFARSVQEAVTTGESDPNVADAQRLMGVIAIYLREMGIDARLLFVSSLAGPNQLVKLDTNQLSQLGVVNIRENGVFSGWTIEPYRNGAVLTGRLTGTATEDQQLTFFCRASAPGFVFMLASWSYASAKPSQATMDDEAIKSAVWGSTVSIGGRTIRTVKGYDSIPDAHVDSDDQFHLTYALSDAEFALAIRSRSLEISISGPHSLGNYGFIFLPPMDGIAAPARIALKSCL